MATNVTIVTNNASTNYTLSTGARGPVGPAGSNAVTSATTSDGTAALYLDSIRFEATNGGPTQLGELAWESTDGSIDAQLENGVIAALAEDGLIRVRNTSGVPIAKGDALRYTGTNGATGRLEVAKWVGANVSNAKTFMGFAACAMADNSNGYAQWFGKLEGITTTGGGEAWIDGQIIYAVPGTSATITDTAPTDAGEYVVAAAVINAGSGTSGSMFVRPSFAKNIASADIVDASSFGLESTAGKAALYGGDGQISAPYFFAAGFPDVPNATYGISSIATVDAIGNPAATMNFPTTGSGTLMLNSNNLSDLSSASTARTNLGAGATGSTIFQAATVAAARETLNINDVFYNTLSDSPSRNNDTFANDDVLAGIPLVENGVYQIVFNIIIAATASSGFKLKFLTSNGALAQSARGFVINANNTNAVLVWSASTGETGVLNRAAATLAYDHQGIITIKASANCNMSLQWAQNTLDAAQTATRLAGSFISVRKLN